MPHSSTFCRYNATSTIQHSLRLSAEHSIPLGGDSITSSSISFLKPSLPLLSYPPPMATLTSVAVQTPVCNCFSYYYYIDCPTSGLMGCVCILALFPFPNAFISVC